MAVFVCATMAFEAVLVFKSGSWVQEEGRLLGKYPAYPFGSFNRLLFFCVIAKSCSVH